MRGSEMSIGDLSNGSVFVPSVALILPLSRKSFA